MRRAPVLAAVLLATLTASPARADHVTSDPRVSAVLGERVSDRSWAVVVDWSINCSGPAPGNALHTGSLNLDDLDSGEATYMGGTAGAAGSDRQPVERRALPRRVRPRIKASCFDSAAGNHGSETIEVLGNAVTVPGLGDDNGDGVKDGARGGRSLPGDDPQGPDAFPGFGGPADPLARGGCAEARFGTTAADTLTGTRAADLVYGLAGNDVLRGQAGDDCLIGGPGKDRLVGGTGRDRLTGGTGADTLVGGTGASRYDAGPGNDVVDARNGRAELVACGSGRDRARVDRSDRVRSCERVERPRRM